MEAEFQKFKASMPLYTREQLVELCLQLWQENRACTIALTEYRASDTRMARDYQDALQKIKELEAQTKDQQKTIDRVCAQNAVLTRQRFGSHNEKLDALHAPFGEEIQDPLSEEADPDQPPTDAEKVPPSPRKSERKKSEAQAADSDGKARTDARKLIADTLGKGRMKKQPTKMDYSSLPHCNTYTLDVEKQDKIYGKDNWVIVNWHKKTLLHRPLTSYYVEEVYTPVIKSLETGELEADPMPPVLLKGSPVSEDLLAFIIYEKYFKSVPLYRLSADMANQGLILPRQDMANWIIRFTEGNLLTPYYYMQKLQCARSYGQSDETPLQVLHEAGRDARTKSYMWIHITGELDEGPFIVVFVYEPTRGTDHLRKYYSGFSGTLSCDAYVSYIVLAKESGGKIILSGCLMHARRRIAEALEIINISKLTKEQIEALPEYQALLLLGKIYYTEDDLKGLNAQERLARRQAEVKPYMDKFFTLIESLDPEDPLLSDKMKDAVTYCRNQKENLYRFLEDGNVPCDNGFAENSIRLYAQGRRNWLFSNTPNGATASAVIYSLIETARLNRANPLFYIKYLLEKAPSYQDLPSGSNRLEELMPWSEQYRQYEETEKKKVFETQLPESNTKPSYRPSRKGNREKLQAVS